MPAAFSFRALKLFMTDIAPRIRAADFADEDS
jgi:hypothetical protein